MFKIGQTPSLSSNPIEHADYLEFECLRQSDGNASGQDLVAALKRVADDLPEKRKTSDSRYEDIVESAFIELKNRTEHSGRGYYRYPFRVSDDSQLLEFVGHPGRCEFYLYMLLATRMDMRTERVQAEINGTELFERVCCEVGRNYLGERSQGIVFGTARRNAGDEVGSFPNAVDDLCQSLKEGVKFFSHSGSTPAAKDGNLDVVVWKAFADDRSGKLIAFGQCKTGTHWAKNVFDLVPDNFWAKWIFSPPVVTPLRLYFIASRVRDSEWYDVCTDAGIMFDRCRILNYAPPMATIRPEWVAWTNASLATHGLNLP